MNENANQHNPTVNESGGSRSGSPASYPSLRPAEFANTIEELEASLADWHKQKYLRLEVDVAATQRKLLEEVGELIEAVQRRDRDAVRLEAADVLFVMCHLVRAVSAGPDSGLQPAIDAKLAIIWRRLREDQQKAVWSRV